jgi:DNA polymerase III subunit epsilon
MGFDWQSSPLAFVDLETTGGRPGASRILEVGILFLWPDGRVEHFNELVNPGVYIPNGITELTGIQPDMVIDRPPFSHFAPTLHHKLSGCLFVAHNARFDYGFLRYELAACGYRLKVPVLCTVKLSRKLNPEWPRHNLDTLIERFQLSVTNRHRAWDDADLLLQLWGKLEQHCGLEQLRLTVDELIREPNVPAHLPVEVLVEAPEASGVYFFHGSAAALLYIGKSRNIKHRLSEHFFKAERDAKEAELIKQTRAITWTETVGEWGALLREAQWVKSKRPLHNKRLRSNDAVGFELVDTPGGGLELGVRSADALMVDGVGERYGFFKSVAAAQRALHEIAKAHELCLVSLGLERSQGSCFAFQLKRCKGSCVGQEALIKHTLRAKLALASLKLKAWPYAGPVAVCERNYLHEREWHVFNHWCYLGSTTDEDDLMGVSARESVWDIDIYYLIKKILEQHPTVQVLKY